MPNQDYPTLNEIAPSWADLAASADIYEGDLLDMVDIAALKWGRKVDIGTQRGTGGRKRKRSVGQPDFEATLTLYRDGHDKLLRALMKKAPRRGNQVLVSLVAFDINVQYTPPGTDAIFHVKIKGCRLAGDSDDAKEGPEVGQLEVPLDVMEIANIIDGQEVVLV